MLRELSHVRHDLICSFYELVVFEEKCMTVVGFRRQQELEVGLEDNPALMSELRALRQRKDELESHLTSLQDSRRHLMVQLEGLMKLLKVCFLFSVINAHPHIFCCCVLVECYIILETFFYLKILISVY